MRYLIIPFFGFVKTALTDVGTIFCQFRYNELEDKVHCIYFLDFLLFFFLPLDFFLDFFYKDRFNVRQFDELLRAMRWGRYIRLSWLASSSWSSSWSSSLPSSSSSSSSSSLPSSSSSSSSSAKLIKCQFCFSLYTTICALHLPSLGPFWLQRSICIYLCS